MTAWSILEAATTAPAGSTAWVMFTNLRIGGGGGAGYPVYEKPRPKKKSIYELLDMGIEQQYKEITKTVEVVKADKKQAKKVSKIIEPYVSDNGLDIESLAKEKMLVTQLLELHNEIIAKEAEQQAREAENQLILQQQYNDLIRQKQINAVEAVMEYERIIVINALEIMQIGVISA